MATDTAGTIPASDLINVAIVSVDGPMMTIGFGGNDGVSFPANSNIYFKIFRVYTNESNGILTHDEITTASTENSALYNVEGTITGNLTTIYNEGAFEATFGGNTSSALYAKTTLNIGAPVGVGTQYFIVRMDVVGAEFPSLFGPSSTYILSNNDTIKRIYISYCKLVGTQLELDISIHNANGSTFSMAAGEYPICKIYIADGNLVSTNVSAAYYALLSENTINMENRNISVADRIVSNDSGNIPVDNAICLRFRITITLAYPNMAITPIVKLL